MSNDYRQRMLAIAEELRAQGVGRHMSSPMIFRLAWRLGFRIRPPLYQPFVTLAAGMALFFAAGWGLLMWLMLWRGQGRSLTSIVLDSAIVGVFLGLMMAFTYRRQARRMTLPPLEGSTSADTLGSSHR